MTYEEFKRELFCNVSGQECSHRGQVQLFENQNAEPIGAGEFFSELNQPDLRGKMVQDDYLCVQWNIPRPMNVRSWKVRALYEKYKTEGWQGVLPEIKEELHYVSSADAENEPEYDTYEKYCEQLVLRPLNYCRNRDSLEENIYWRFGDMAMVLYAQMGNVGQEHITIKVVRSMTENWKISRQTLLANALLNTYSKICLKIAETLIISVFPLFFVTNLLLVQLKKYYFIKFIVSLNWSIVLWLYILFPTSVDL